MGSLERLRALPRPNRRELMEVATLLVLSPFVFAPAPVERFAAEALARWQFRRGSWTRRARLRALPPALTRSQGRSRLDLARASESESNRERIRVLRGALLPRWRRRVRLTGEEHVRDALAAGHGAILWVNRCNETNVAVKQAVAGAGFPIYHLSRPGHPFSGAPFGVRYLDPFLRRPEMPHLAERIAIQDANPLSALRRLRALLAENKVVSITVAVQASSHEDVPLLGGIYHLARGPMQLAASSGGALLPVFASGASENTTLVEIGPPLPPPGAKGDGVRQTALAMAAWLERQALAHPEAWVGWRGRQFENRAASFDSGG